MQEKEREELAHDKYMASLIYTHEQTDGTGVDSMITLHSQY